MKATIYTNKVKFNIIFSNQREFETIKQSLNRHNGNFFTFTEKQLEEGFERTVNVQEIILIELIDKTILSEDVVSQDGAKNAVSKILTPEEILAQNKLMNPNVVNFEQAAKQHAKLKKEQNIQ